MSMTTLELTIRAEEPLQEFLIAELDELGFEGYAQEETLLKAYLPVARWDDVKREQLERWLRANGVTAPVTEQVIGPQNWNEQWEETIQPVAVGGFVIKPTWTEVPAAHAGLTVLEIDPKMSFGTGYHESTRLALRLLRGRVPEGGLVLDAGTGTGILAIAALKRGAKRVVAFDIDPWAQQNAVENFYLNGVADHVDFRAGAIETVPEAGFDLVLANINRNVLLEMVGAFAEKTRVGGGLVLAGLLRQDRDRMIEAAARAGFTRVQEDEEGAWWAAAFVREGDA
jgi:ribosomal protein L11 methyltransferase